MADELARRMTGVYGEAGARWARTLPDTIAACEQRWSIAVSDPFAGLTYASSWKISANGPLVPR